MRIALSSAGGLGYAHTARASARTNSWKEKSCVVLAAAVVVVVYEAVRTMP